MRGIRYNIAQYAESKDGIMVRLLTSPTKTWPGFDSMAIHKRYPTVHFGGYLRNLNLVIKKMYRFFQQKCQLKLENSFLSFLKVKIYFI